jgi:hypothetical protein
MRTKLTALHCILILALAVSSAVAADPPGKQAMQALLEDMDPSNPQQLLVILQFARETGKLGDLMTQTVTRVEEARTDRQLTASASTPGSVAKADKPGIADLLAIALERGAVKKATEGTNVTLSTTPYMLLTGFGTGDTDANWESLQWARRVAVGATFSSNDVTTGDFSSFVSGQVKVTFGANRSGRDAAVQMLIPDGDMQAALGGLTACNDFMQTTAGVEVDRQRRAFTSSIAASLPADGAQREARLAQIVDPSVVPMSPADQVKFDACLEKTLLVMNAVEADTALVKQYTDKYLTENTRNQFATTFLFQRDPEKSDYTTLKLIYGRNFSTSSFNLNGEISFNQQSHTPGTTTVPTAKLDRIRAYSVESAFNTGKMAGNRVDASVSAKWYDPQDSTDGYVLSGQAMLNLNLNSTIKFPIALTYANRTVTAANTQKGLQFEFGLAALLDNAFSALRRQ